MLCALSFVFMAFTHSLTHPVEIPSSTTTIVSAMTDGSDDFDDGKILLSYAADCHTCSTVTDSVVPTEINMPTSGARHIVRAPIERYLPVSVRADIPPPKEI